MTQEELQDIDLDVYNMLHKLDVNDGHTHIYLRACYKKGLEKSIITYGGEDTNLIDMISEYMEQDEGISRILYMGVLNWAYESESRIDSLINILGKLKDQIKK